MVGANYPSSWLASLFSFLEDYLRALMIRLNFSTYIISLLMDGIYRTVSWVISAMLPPMAIFFPLFTLLEDSGYLPRVAFNLDNIFRKCGSNGKQALTICMGFGCNACGVAGCRIINSSRERLISILTNTFIPCNGRFPTLISIILIFMTAGTGLISSLKAGIILTVVIIFSLVFTFLVSKILSLTLLKNEHSTFVLELPSYRRPQILQVIIRSILDRTFFVLGRAIVVAIPAGFIIWILSNTYIGSHSLLLSFTDFMNPFGRFIGVDGVILTAFLLGFPANEIVIPVMLMCYLSTGTLTDFTSLTQLQDILINCGWTLQTAVSVIILCIFHFPCGTTCLTIKKETGSLKWTALAIVIPTLTGVLLCLALNIILLAF
jgi:ferrous iron transport protein B